MPNNNAPARFRKKPVEIQAVQFVNDKTEPCGTNLAEVIAFIGGDHGDRFIVRPPRGVGIVTLEGTMWASVGDWIIRGIKGEFYPCRADIFAATYDVAPEPLELTGLERAAAAKSEHMATCHEPVCVECMRELRLIRRIVKAIRPVIADEFERAADAQMAAANDEGYRRGWKDGYGRGRDDEAADAPIPVAAASEPEGTQQ